LTMQLFEAVKFMHDHNVAHMDLKPSNLLIPSDYGRLTVIDFGHSFRLRNEAQLLEGHAGTEGYIAPEVGHMKFRPIRADLWSVGKVVQ
ncbi:kinase-like protein, partial [Pholiota conissans]